jgi:hypothetical protein
MERDLNPPLPSSATPQLRRTNVRASAVVWLRRTHGWVGLWGATLGLLFGLSGIWLNHRSVLKLPIEQARSNSQLALPGPPPASAQDLAAWLQVALQMDAPANNLRVEPARPVAWAERAKGPGRGEAAPAPPALLQPEHWTISFGGPRETVQAEYWAGNRSVSVRRTANGVVGTLANLHKGVGMPVAWVLLVDTLAGSMILLSLSGLALWMLTRRRRAVGIALFGAGLAAVAGLALAAL